MSAEIEDVRENVATFLLKGLKSRN